MDEKELKKELARLKRLAVEIAGERFTISSKIRCGSNTMNCLFYPLTVEAIKEAEAFKEKHAL